MGKNNFLKGTILGLAICGSLFAVNNYIENTSHYDSQYVQSVYAASTEAIVNDTNLRTAICKNLGKSVNETLYIDDFMKAKAFNENPEKDNAIEKRSLDFSYSNITDITELIQFQLPSTLVAIDLTGNNITNYDLAKITAILNLSTADEKIIVKQNPEDEKEEGREIIIRANLRNQILKVKLNLNHIDLSTLNESQLINERFIYAIQNLDIKNNKMYLFDEVKDAKYYIRSNDENYLSFNFFHNPQVNDNGEKEGRYQPVLNQVTPLITEDKLGEYQFNIANPPITESGYFYGAEIHEDLKVFTAEIEPGFFVERRSPIFPLKANNIIINGLLGDVDISIHDTKINTTGIKDVNVEVTNIDTTRIIKLQFEVKDTIAPVITLEPNNTNIIYWRQNKIFDASTDPGYTGTDSGDNLTAFVNVDYGNIDVTKIGSYTIKYNLTDLAGNKAQEVVRTVIVQEQVLDEIKLKTTTQSLVVGQDIVLTVGPSGNIDISKYKDLVYTWYLNGEAFKTTSGDKVSGKSTTVITLDKTSNVEITVELQAKQVIDNGEIYVTSNKLNLKPEYAESSTTIIIAMVTALGIVLAVFITSLINKARKAKKINKKSKSGSNETKPARDESIQVIKNYGMPANNNSDSKTDSKANKKSDDNKK